MCRIYLIDCISSYYNILFFSLNWMHLSHFPLVDKYVENSLSKILIILKIYPRKIMVK